MPVLAHGNAKESSWNAGQVDCSSGLCLFCFAGRGGDTTGKLQICRLSGCLGQRPPRHCCAPQGRSQSDQKRRDRALAIWQQVSHASSHSHGQRFHRVLECLRFRGFAERRCGARPRPGKEIRSYLSCLITWKARRVSGLPQYVHLRSLCLLLCLRLSLGGVVRRSLFD